MDSRGKSSERKDITAYRGTMKIMRTMYLCSIQKPLSICVFISVVLQQVSATRSHEEKQEDP